MEMTILVAGVGTAICLTTFIGVMWWAGKPYRPEDAVKAQIKAMRAIQMKNGTRVDPEMPYMLV